MKNSFQFSVFSFQLGRISTENRKPKTENCFSEESFMSSRATPRNDENRAAMYSNLSRLLLTH